MSLELQKQLCSRCGEPDAEHDSAPQCRYNGWKNYETWCVHLWLTNEEGSYNYWRDAAQEVKEQAPAVEQVTQGIWTVEQAARYNLADMLKEEIRDSKEANEIGQGTLYGDLLGAALSEVNWTEIAEAFLED